MSFFIEIMSFSIEILSFFIKILVFSIEIMGFFIEILSFSIEILSFSIETMSIFIKILSFSIEKTIIFVNQRPLTWCAFTAAITAMQVHGRSPSDDRMDRPFDRYAIHAFPIPGELRGLLLQAPSRTSHQGRERSISF